MKRKRKGKNRASEGSERNSELLHPPPLRIMLTPLSMLTVLTELFLFDDFRIRNSSRLFSASPSRNRTCDPSLERAFHPPHMVSTSAGTRGRKRTGTASSTRLKLLMRV